MSAFLGNTGNSMSMPIAQFVLALLLATVSGAAVMQLFAHRRITRLREDKARLTAELEAERRTVVERTNSFEKARQQLTESFRALAADALKSNSSEFLRLAEENLKKFQGTAQSDLAQREKAVENLVKPIREALEKTEAQIRVVEKERKEAYGALSKHLETMAETQRQLQGETRNLVQALRRPEVRGQWGEMTLKRLVELAGMVEYCDFQEQPQVRTEDGAMLRPDMIVHMPDGRSIVVDAKTPLDAYLSAVEASDDEARDKALQRHGRKVRERVRELAAKAYWQQFKNAPDFVVLFIPGEQFLTSALDVDRQLLEDALANKVILATPTSFIALLRAVAFGWRQEALAENAEQIRQLGEEMHGRLATFVDYLSKLGKSLDQSVGHFNKAVGSFDSRVLPQARKFGELGILAKKPIPEAPPIEKAVRELAETGAEEV